MQLIIRVILWPRDPAAPLHEPGAIACLLATAVLFAVGYDLAISYVKEQIPAPAPGQDRPRGWR